MALSCPVSKQLILYREELDSAPLIKYSFSEAVLQPDICKGWQITFFLTLLDGTSVTLLICFKSEDDLFGWTRAFGNAGAKVC